MGPSSKHWAEPTYRWSHLPIAQLQPRPRPRGQDPPLPRVGTPIFISAVWQRLPQEQAQAIERRYRRTLDEAVDHLALEMTTENMLGFLRGATADASSDGDARDPSCEASVLLAHRFGRQD